MHRTRRRSVKRARREEAERRELWRLEQIAVARILREWCAEVTEMLHSITNRV